MNLQSEMDMLNMIFSIPTLKSYDDYTIEVYEELHKTYVFETLSEFFNEEDEEYMLSQYNPENLVYYFKEILNY